MASDHMTVRWVPVSEGLPKRAGKFVVEIEDGEMCYLSTRSFNPENADGHKWPHPNGRVVYWLEGLQSCTEMRAWGLL